MLILSFDVGIKNLAYSISKYNKENNTYKILEWDIINILKDEIDSQKKCDKCSKFAKYITKNDEYCFCQKHKNLINLYKPFELKKYETKIDKCSVEKCNKIVKYTLNNKKICASHKVQLQKEYKECYNYLRLKNVNCKTYPIHDILLKIIKIFNEKYLYFLLVDKVLIELQPVLRGPKMKTISNHIYSYFLINGVCNDNFKMNTVSYINASNKLKLFKDNENKDLTQYKNRKKLAIENVNYFLKYINQKTFEKFFNDSKKKDDLADSLLQSLYYLESNYNFKIN